MEHFEKKEGKRRRGCEKGTGIDQTRQREGEMMKRLDMRDHKRMHTISHTTNTLTGMYVGDTADVPGGDVLVEGSGTGERFEKRGRGDGVVRSGEV